MAAIESKFVGNESDAIILGVLDAVERDASITQRTVAKELGIALGLTNAYLKRCVKKGLIKVSQVPTRRYVYFLTPKGLAEKSHLTAKYLTNSFSFFRQARLEFAAVYAAAVRRGQARLALVGSGDLAEIAGLVAREHAIEIVGTIAASQNADRLAADAAKLGQVDAIVLTSLEYPHEVCAASIAAFGQDRVHAPPLLRVRSSSVVPAATVGAQ